MKTWKDSKTWVNSQTSAPGNEFKGFIQQYHREWNFEDSKPLGKTEGRYLEHRLHAKKKCAEKNAHKSVTYNRN